jgi:hypothetical protein
MVECVFMEVIVPFKASNSGDVRREVGWPLASLDIISRDQGPVVCVCMCVCVCVCVCVSECVREIETGKSRGR